MSEKVAESELAGAVRSAPADAPDGDASAARVAATFAAFQEFSRELAIDDDIFALRRLLELEAGR